MNLTIDIGNSSAKAALFDGGRLVRLMGEEEVARVVAGDRAGVEFDRAIVVSTSGKVPLIEGAIVLDRSTRIPIKNRYGTPATLGYDRLAAAVGARAIFPDLTALIVDFGTAITCDVVTREGEFLGGNISPGAAMRFRALHDYTGGLPLGELTEAGGTVELPARNTRDAIESGVVEGIVAETERYIARTMEKFGEIAIIFTGGDAEYFVERVKYPIFAVSELIFYGLNAILKYNAKR